jgi:hypothetical protein
MAHNGHGQLPARNENDIENDLWRPPSENDISLKAGMGEKYGSVAGASQVDFGKLKFEDGESREVSLRNELENVRKVNEAIEGVIESLDKAKGSMRVSLLLLYPCSRPNVLLAVCQSNGQFMFHSPQHVDTHIVTDRAQSKVDPEPWVARS